MSTVLIAPSAQAEDFAQAAPVVGAAINTLTRNTMGKPTQVTTVNGEETSELYVDGTGWVEKVTRPYQVYRIVGFFGDSGKVSEVWMYWGGKKRTSQLSSFKSRDEASIRRNAFQYAISTPLYSTPTTVYVLKPGAGALTVSSTDPAVPEFSGTAIMRKTSAESAATRGTGVVALTAKKPIRAPKGSWS